MLIRIAVITLCLTAPVAAMAEDTLVFPMKVFTDLGHIVHVEGTLSGDGVGYPRNTTALTCYQERQECDMVFVGTQGRQIFSLGLPQIFTARVWEKDRIIADFDSPCGKPPNAVFAKSWQTSTSETLIIDRARETVELNEHPSNEKAVYHWTIENPKLWENLSKRYR